MDRLPQDLRSTGTRPSPKHRPKQERMIVMGLLALVGGLIAMDALLLTKLM